MKKTILLTTCLLFIYTSIVALPNNDKTIKDLVNYLKNSGLVVSSEEDFWYMLAGANDGKRLTIEGDTIEIYKYDTDVPKQKEILDDIKKKGKIIAMDMSMPVVVNGTFVLYVTEEHPAKQKIIEIFNIF